MQQSIKVLLSTALCLALMTGCASTPRQPPSFASLGNFEQFQLNQAIFRVKFTGDARMSQGTAEEITLLKAAKTTIDAGYRYFHVLNDNKEPPVRRTVVYSDPWYGLNGYGYSGFGPYGFRHSRWPYYGSSYGWGWPSDPFYGTTVYNVDPVEVSYTIKCSNTMSAQNDEFDAQLIMRSLGPKYYLNTDGSARVVEPPIKTP